MAALVHQLCCAIALLPAAELGLRACAVMDALLGEHLDMLFGQHISVAIACALFFTVRLGGGPG